MIATQIENAPFIGISSSYIYSLLATQSVACLFVGIVDRGEGSEDCTIAHITTSFQLVNSWMEVNGAKKMTPKLSN